MKRSHRLLCCLGVGIAGVSFCLLMGGCIILESPLINGEPAETVLSHGQSIMLSTSEGVITCDYISLLRRKYTWNGYSRAISLTPRDIRWYGALGIYSDGFILSSSSFPFQKAGQVSRIVAQESELNFNSLEDFVKWRDNSWLDLAFNSDGYGGGWKISPSREQLNVDIWRIYIGGKPPKNLPGANDKSVILRTTIKSQRSQF